MAEISSFFCVFFSLIIFRSSLFSSIPSLINFSTCVCKTYLLDFNSTSLKTYFVDKALIDCCLSLIFVLKSLHSASNSSRLIERDDGGGGCNGRCAPFLCCLKGENARDLPFRVRGGEIWNVCCCASDDDPTGVIRLLIVAVRVLAWTTEIGFSSCVCGGWEGWISLWMGGGGVKGILRSSNDVGEFEGFVRVWCFFVLLGSSIGWFLGVRSAKGLSGMGAVERYALMAAALCMKFCRCVEHYVSIGIVFFWFWRGCNRGGSGFCEGMLGRMDVGRC